MPGRAILEQHLRHPTPSWKEWERSGGQRRFWTELHSYDPAPTAVRALRLKQLESHLARRDQRLSAKLHTEGGNQAPANKSRRSLRSRDIAVTSAAKHYLRIRRCNFSDLQTQSIGDTATVIRVGLQEMLDLSLLNRLRY